MWSDLIQEALDISPEVFEVGDSPTLDTPIKEERSTPTLRYSCKHCKGGGASLVTLAKHIKECASFGEQDPITQEHYTAKLCSALQQFAPDINPKERGPMCPCCCVSLADEKAKLAHLLWHHSKQELAPHANELMELLEPYDAELSRMTRRGGKTRHK